MNTYKIPYVTKTKNPNAGNTVYYIQQRPEYFLTVNKEIYHHDICFDHASEDTKGFIFIYLLNKPLNDFDDAFKNKIKNHYISYVIKYAHHPVYSISPEPQFLYIYPEEYYINCSYCNERFNYKDLLDDSDLDYYSTEICPKCGAWDCCKLEFEK